MVCGSCNHNDTCKKTEKQVERCIDLAHERRADEYSGRSFTF